MQSTLLNADKEQTYALVFEEGEEFSEGMLAFAKEHDLTAAHFTAIGAFQDAKLGWFNPQTKEYEENLIQEQVEVLSLVGNVAEYEGKPKIHAHVVLGKRDAVAVGGHILEAHVRPTLEVTLVKSPRHLHRRHDETTGLPLIRPEQTGLPPRAGRAANAGLPGKDSGTGHEQQADSESEEPERMGTGLEMGYSVSKPKDTTDWRQCPDCKMWVHGLNRPACPYCGYVFGQPEPSHIKG